MLPPEFDPLLADLADESEHAMFRHAPVLMMSVNEKARVAESMHVGGNNILSVQLCFLCQLSVTDSNTWQER